MAKNNKQSNVFYTGLQSFEQEKKSVQRPVQTEPHSQMSGQREGNTLQSYEMRQYRKKEIKSVRFNLLITPTLHQALRQIADLNGESINQIANRLLEEYVRKNGFD